MKKNIAKFGVVLGALVAFSGVQQVQAEDLASDGINATMIVEPVATVSASADVEVTPTTSQILTDNAVTLSGAAASGIKLTLNSNTPVDVTWTAGAGTILNADIKLNGTASGGVVHSGTVDEDGVTPIPVDLEISNLRAYNVSSSGYTKSITFTVVTQ